MTIKFAGSARPGRTKRVIVVLAAVVAGTVGAIAAPGSPASAGTPHCVSTLLYNEATGGCDGNSTAGQDRMDLECEAIGSDGFYYWVKSAWHNRYADWETVLGCYGGTGVAVYATFDHQN